MKLSKISLLSVLGAVVLSPLAGWAEERSHAIDRYRYESPRHRETNNFRFRYRDDFNRLRRYDHRRYDYPHPRNWYHGTRHRDPYHGQIHYGIRTGRLSQNEVRALRHKERELREREGNYWADGRLSSNERRDLDRERRKLEGSLRHELNDGERRDRYYGWHRYAW